MPTSSNNAVELPRADEAQAQVEAEVRALLAGGQLDLPYPGAGQTFERLRGLAAIGSQSLDVVRLAEGHADAVAIAAELHGPRPEVGELWGVWAAESGGSALHAESGPGGGWRLFGHKAYCSGAAACDGALVTAMTSEGSRLFSVRRSAAMTVEEGTWPAVGMAGSDGRSIGFDGAEAVPVGEPGDYLTRPGFWAGAVGVAACWYGGARGVAAPLRRAAERQSDGKRPVDSFVLAALGAADAALTAMVTVLRDAAADIDADPQDRQGHGALRAHRVRAVVEAGATSILAGAGRALGAGPLCHDAAHARRVADLTVYLRQSHGDRDLAAEGRLLLTSGQSW